MAAGFSWGLNLVSIVLFLLPGLIGVKLGLLLAERADWFNRIDTIALSFAVSLTSMGIVYGWHSQFYDGWMTTEDVSQVWTHLPSAITVYLEVVLASLLVGVLLAVLNFGGDHVAKRSGVWNKFFATIDAETGSDPAQVRVRMQSGDELRGRVEDKGEIGSNRDIWLENPLRIIRQEDGSKGKTYRYTGYAYLHNQDISHVEFDSLLDADDAVNPGDDDAEPEPDDEIDDLEETADEEPGTSEPESDEPPSP